jgi:hypothetical protein
MGRPMAVECPFAAGPRNSGQSSADDFAVETARRIAAAVINVRIS